MKYCSKAGAGGDEVQITIASNLRSVTEARLRAEIITAAGQVRASGERTISVRPGTQNLILQLNHAALKENDRTERWDRLRYELRYIADQNPVRLDGSVALGRITPDLFDLYVTKLRRLVAGSPYGVRIRAQHPLTAKAASGVIITAKLELAGKFARSIPLRAPKELSAAITVSLSDVILPGANTVELVRSGSASPATAQVVSTFYVPWKHSEAGTGTKQVPGDSDQLQLGVRFDKTKAAVGEEIRCTVEAQRIGFRGYGMMLAEIGLPPGADVDRSSLDKAATDSGWTLNHYDVLPDRVIAYVWPFSGNPTQFSFTFRPRLGMHAQTAPSVLYDYYNPEARAVVKPVTFQVQ
ncbi:MAG: hypothetical protein L0Z53_09675 [Acidobacteriales bacterium]|nr:hypothetical protein [Terriglobales bacterium]